MHFSFSMPDKLLHAAAVLKSTLKKSLSNTSLLQEGKSLLHLM